MARKCACADATSLNALIHLHTLNVSYTKVSSAALAQLTGLSGLQTLCACACGLHSVDMLGVATTLSRLSCLDFSSSWCAGSHLLHLSICCQSLSAV